MIVRGVFEQSKHSYKIRGYVQRYIKSVIRCQRIVRASYIRSKKRAELVADAFEDFEAVLPQHNSPKISVISCSHTQTQTYKHTIKR